MSFLFYNFLQKTKLLYQTISLFYCKGWLKTVIRISDLIWFNLIWAEEEENIMYNLPLGYAIDALLFSEIKKSALSFTRSCYILYLISNLVLWIYLPYKGFLFQYLLLAISSLSVFPSSWYSSNHLPWGGKTAIIVK